MLAGEPLYNAGSHRSRRRLYIPPKTITKTKKKPMKQKVATAKVVSMEWAFVMRQENRSTQPQDSRWALKVAGVSRNLVGWKERRRHNMVRTALSVFYLSQLICNMLGCSHFVKPYPHRRIESYHGHLSDAWRQAAIRYAFSSLYPLTWILPSRRGTAKC